MSAIGKLLCSGQNITYVKMFCSLRFQGRGTARFPWGLAYFSWDQGWFWYLVIGESILATTLYFVMRKRLARVRWSSVE
jgi:hypothetical protein